MAPRPIIIPEAANEREALEFKEEEWEQAPSQRVSFPLGSPIAVNMQNMPSLPSASKSALKGPASLQADGSEVINVRMRLAGNPGLVRLHVQDTDAKLQADRLELNLKAGPTSCIMFDAPPSLNSGLQCLLSELRVKAMDGYHNIACNDFEVRPPFQRQWPLAVEDCSYRLIRAIRLPGVTCTAIGHAAANSNCGQWIRSGS